MRRQAKQLESQGAAAKQVGRPSSDLSGTGAAKGEAQFPAFDQPVDFVQESGHLLDFVDDYLSSGIRGLRLDL